MDITIFQMDYSSSLPESRNWWCRLI